MSSLTFAERKKFERLLGMGSGYVLDFTNPGFQQFVRESVRRDIFDSRYNFASGSKANRLRAFWEVENDGLVSKLMDDLLVYGEFPPDGVTASACRQAVDRLKGTVKSGPSKEREPSPGSSTARNRSLPLAALKDEFLALASEDDRMKAGFQLEKLLNALFNLFELGARRPFRVIGEQIDGSFAFEGQVYLVESKWQKAPLPEADLLVFRGKIEGKSTFTRGVFIALNDVSEPARDAITRGKAPSFFVMNGYDLLMVLSEHISLDEFIRKRVRLLAEEGRVCVPYSELIQH